MTTFPSPEATFAEVQAWYKTNAPPEELEHEAPPVANGPSLMCNACEKVRVKLTTPFCKTCLGLIGDDIRSEFNL